MEQSVREFGSTSALITVASGCETAMARFVTNRACRLLITTLFQVRLVARMLTGFVSRFLFIVDRTFTLILFGIYTEYIFLLIAYNLIVTWLLAYAFAFGKIYDKFISNKFRCELRFAIPFSHEVALPVQYLYTYFVVLLFFIENTFMTEQWNNYVTNNHNLTEELRNDKHEITSTLFENALVSHYVMFFVALILKVSMTRMTTRMRH